MAMSSIPYSRYIFGSVPWYSFLIVSGVVFAVFFAVREERKAGLPKDTVIDLALWLIPFGIIGARIYYVIFSWKQFRNDPLSVLRIWEGGIAIYGGILAGLIVLLLFCRRRRLSPLLLCDMIAPGLSFAQAVGRWGNWFNIEAYGRTVTRTELCFFPLSLQVPSDSFSWHLATFFYESVWDLIIFVFLITARKKLLRKPGDVFFFYVMLYASGRLVIEELRLDSLYAASSVRISQLLSVLVCLAVIVRYFVLLIRRYQTGIAVRFAVFPVALLSSFVALVYSLTGSAAFFRSFSSNFLLLSCCALLMIISFFLIFRNLFFLEVRHADNRI